MMRLGLVGYPLEHSLSPILHSAALQACGLHGEYSLYSVHPDDAAGLGTLAERIRTGELAGLNVTIPLKQAIIPLLDELTPQANAIGAVNTIYLKGARVLGDNTDAPGFLADLEHFLPRPRSAVVLGAGGAARAVVYALWSGSCKVTVAARRMEQAYALTCRFADVHAIELSAAALRETSAELIVNTTPAGMFPNIESCAWPAGLPFPRHAALYDLVYNPPETRLVSEARAAGLRAVGGLGMLVEQAALSFELWTGCKVRRDALIGALGQLARSL